MRNKTPTLILSLFTVLISSFGLPPQSFAKSTIRSFECKTNGDGYPITVFYSRDRTNFKTFIIWMRNSASSARKRCEETAEKFNQNKEFANLRFMVDSVDTEGNRVICATSQRPRSSYLRRCKEAKILIRIQEGDRKDFLASLLTALGIDADPSINSPVYGQDDDVTWIDLEMLMPMLPSESEFDLLETDLKLDIIKELSPYSIRRSYSLNAIKINFSIHL